MDHLAKETRHKVTVRSYGVTNIRDCYKIGVFRNHLPSLSNLVTAQGKRLSTTAKFLRISIDESTLFWPLLI